MHIDPLNTVKDYFYSYFFVLIYIFSMSPEDRVLYFVLCTFTTQGQKYFIGTL
jgi:hypothetical protein